MLRYPLNDRSTYMSQQPPTWPEWWMTGTPSCGQTSQEHHIFGTSTKHVPKWCFVKIPLKIQAWERCISGNLVQSPPKLCHFESIWCCAHASASSEKRHYEVRSTKSQHLKQISKMFNISNQQKGAGRIPVVRGRLQWALPFTIRHQLGMSLVRKIIYILYNNIIRIRHGCSNNRSHSRYQHQSWQGWSAWTIMSYIVVCQMNEACLWRKVAPAMSWCVLRW
jgi:hypothetical protein